MQVRREVQTDETLPLSQALPLAVQHLMAMFGATVLVPADVKLANVRTDLEKIAADLMVDVKLEPAR